MSSVLGRVGLTLQPRSRYLINKKLKHTKTANAKAQAATKEAKRRVRKGVEEIMIRVMKK